MNRKQFENGLLAWLCGPGVSLVWRTKYRYGTAILPRLPDYDREKYPCGVYEASGRHLLMLQSPAHLVWPNSKGEMYLGPGPGEDYLLYLYQPEIMQWTLIGEYSNNAETGLLYISEPTWSNYDILDKDGNLYLAASEPVPFLIRVFDKTA